MPDCWLEVSLHPEGPATDQLDQVFPWFSSLLEKMLSWNPKVHVGLYASHAALPMITSKFRPTVTLQMLDEHFTIMMTFQRAIKINSDHSQ
jgi:hypothetical protein